jgi:nicotinamide-nucleotide amidase
VAEIAGAEPEIHRPSLEKMKARFEAANFELTPNNMRQVRTPRGSRAFLNRAGLAPGFEIEIHDSSVFVLPGPPHELKAIFGDSVSARLGEIRAARGDRVEHLAKRIFRVFGRGESHIATKLEGLIGDVTGASLNYQVKFPETLVKVVVRDRDAESAAARLAAVDAEVRARLTYNLYGTDDDTLSAVVGSELGDRGLTLATAESCTGGLIGGLLTEVPGSSSYYVGGGVTYSNEEKVRQLDVSEQTLLTHGAVSEECIREMAAGIRRATGADIGVAVSGIAGPGGGTPDKPVGTVWLAVAGPGDNLRTKRFVWPGSRTQIRNLAAHWALALILRQVRSEPAPSESKGSSS